MSDWLVLLAVLLVPLIPVLPDLWLSWLDRVAPVSVRLEVDAAGARRMYADGAVEAVTWEQLEEVGVLASAEGPGPLEIYLLLYGPDETGVVVGVDEACEHGLLSHLLPLQGFDAGSFARATALDTESLATIWRRGESAPYQEASTSRGESPAVTKA